MARITRHWLAGAALAGLAFALGGQEGCSTAEVSPKGPLPELPPPYVQVPHPAGYDLADLRAIFTDRSAPKEDELKGCDGDFRKLKSLTESNDELSQGARELVRHDPIKYHWCFYGTILRLEEDLKAEDYLEERQKKVLDTYGFLTPIARAFMLEYHDSRYMRWAVRHYRKISEWVFYRKPELTPEETSELVEAANPLGLLREPSPELPVLEKYNILKPEVPPSPVQAADTAAPASEIQVTPKNAAAPEAGRMPSAVPGVGGSAPVPAPPAVAAPPAPPEGGTTSAVLDGNSVVPAN